MNAPEALLRVELDGGLDGDGRDREHRARQQHRRAPEDSLAAERHEQLPKEQHGAGHHLPRGAARAS